MLQFNLTNVDKTGPLALKKCDIMCVIVLN